MKHYVLPVALAFLCSDVFAQDAKTDSEDMYELSLEELMSINIVSASKKSESTFEAPVTSYVVTRQDILNSGATSIPEALRLAPGLIVREIANGSYDVSIRGGKDNLPSHQFTYLNTSILAMINGRPVFNYLQGGTYWENLPIDVADVEQIEIVYGPNAPLYGPNAVDGVINIITRKGTGDSKTYATATTQFGKSNIFSALVGTKLTDKLELSVSANNTNRKRYVTEFFDPNVDAFITDLKQSSNPALASDPFSYYPDPSVSAKRSGANFNLYYTPTSKTVFTLNSGYNDNRTISGINAGSTVNQMTNSSFHHLLKAEVSNFTFQTSILSGRQGLVGNVAEYNYDYVTIDNYLDYNLKVNDKLSLRPALSYQNATIDDRKFTVDVNKTGLFNNKATMYNYAASLKADYSPIPAVRLIGAVRADKFKAPDDTYISYQGIVNYKLNSKNIARFLAGRSYAGSFINQAYSNFSISDNAFANVIAKGNDNLKLLQNNILELGYRSQLTRQISIDISLFDQQYSDFSAQLTRVTKEPVFFPVPEKGEFSLLYQNIDLKSHQQGATITLNMFVGKVNIRPFVTLQQTKLTNYSPYYNEFHPLFYPVYNIDNKNDQKSDYTPSSFGGLYVNVPVSKWNFNVSSYYYSNYKLNGNSSVNQSTGELVARDIENIGSKVLFNANIGYKFTPNFTVFANGRNLFGQTARESYGSDQIGRMVMMGLNINL